MALCTIWEGCAAYAEAGALVGETARARWFATGARYEALNGVFAGPSITRAPEVPEVSRAVAVFRDHEAPALWHVGSALGEPAPAAPEGLTYYETEPLMIARIGRYEAPHVHGLRIVPVTGPQGVLDWVRIWTGQRSGPDVDDAARLRFGSGGVFTHFIAVLDGRPVGCSAAFAGRRAGEIQHIVTVPALRHRGIGTALTIAALRALGFRGIDTAVLTSSPDGERIYRRLGFRRVGTVRRYLWSPMDGRNLMVITQSDGGRNDRAPVNDVAP